MSEKATKQSPPYATYTSFVKLLNDLKDSVVPSRIDASLFGNKSGSVTYSVLAALRSMKLIDDHGKPSADFKALVAASDNDRKPLMQKALQRAFPTLWSGGIDLSTVTAGQFDDHVRQEYDVKGSTVDKIAAFFIAAATFAEVPLSSHLKGRKPTFSSPSSKKSAKQRKQQDEGAEGREIPPAPPAPPAVESKALEYQLIDLMSEPDIDGEVKNSIWSLVQYLTARKARRSTPDNA